MNLGTFFFTICLGVAVATAVAIAINEQEPSRYPQDGWSSSKEGWDVKRWEQACGTPNTVEGDFYTFHRTQTGIEANINGTTHCSVTFNEKGRPRRLQIDIAAQTPAEIELLAQPIVAALLEEWMGDAAAVVHRAAEMQPSRLMTWEIPKFLVSAQLSEASGALMIIVQSR